MEVKGLTIPPFDNLGHGYPIVLEPLVGGVKFLRRFNRQGQVVHVLALALRREFGTIEHREGIATADLDVVMPPPISRTRGTYYPHPHYAAATLHRGFHLV